MKYCSSRFTNHLSHQTWTWENKPNNTKNNNSRFSRCWGLNSWMATSLLSLLIYQYGSLLCKQLLNPLPVIRARGPCETNSLNIYEKFWNARPLGESLDLLLFVHKGMPKWFPWQFFQNLFPPTCMTFGRHTASHWNFWKSLLVLWL